MSINLIIKERLQLFLHLLDDIEKYKTNPSQKDKELEIPLTIKQNIQTVLQSQPLYNYFTTKNEIAHKKNQLKSKNKSPFDKRLIPHSDIDISISTSKRSVNTSCFNQRTIKTINQFYTSSNEADLLNINLCYLMFDIIKSCLQLGIEIKETNTYISSNFVLSSKSHSNIYNQSTINSINSKKPKQYFKASYSANKKQDNDDKNTFKNMHCKNYKVVNNINDVNINTPSAKERMKYEYLPKINANNNNKNHKLTGCMSMTNLRRHFYRRKSTAFEKGSYLNKGYCIRRNSQSIRELDNKKYELKSENYDYKEIFKYFNMLKHS